MKLRISYLRLSISLNRSTTYYIKLNRHPSIYLVNWQMYLTHCYGYDMELLDVFKS